MGSLGRFESPSHRRVISWKHRKYHGMPRYKILAGAIRSTTSKYRMLLPPFLTTLTSTIHGFSLMNCLKEDGIVVWIGADQVSNRTAHDYVYIRGSRRVPN
jgi:hypothetical protein